MKAKAIIITSIIVMILMGCLVMLDRYYMTVTWDGSKDVFVRFDRHFAELNARVNRYSNEPIEHIKSKIMPYTTEDAITIDDYSLPLIPREENGEIMLQSRGSGKRSVLHTDYEYWTTGFLAEIETNDGRRFYCWAESDVDEGVLTATFTIEKSQQIGAKNDRRKILDDH